MCEQETVNGPDELSGRKTTGLDADVLHQQYTILGRHYKNRKLGLPSAHTVRAPQNETAGRWKTIAWSDGGTGDSQHESAPRISTGIACCNHVSKNHKPKGIPKPCYGELRLF